MTTLMNDYNLFSYCVEQLFRYFIQITANSVSPENQSKIMFRIPITFYHVRENKKFIILTKDGELKVTIRELECIQCLINSMTAKETADKLNLL